MTRVPYGVVEAFDADWRATPNGLMPGHPQLAWYGDDGFVLWVWASSATPSDDELERCRAALLLAWQDHLRQTCAMKGVQP